MRLKERKLRRIIRNVIRESMSIEDISGPMSAEDLRSGMPSSGPEWTDHADQMTHDHGVSINDGFLNRDEWACLFDLIDMNGDEVIRREEWDDAFDQFDLDHDQKISMDELENACKDSSNH